MYDNQENLLRSLEYDSNPGLSRKRKKYLISYKASASTAFAAKAAGIVSRLVQISAHAHVACFSYNTANNMPNAQSPLALNSLLNVAS